MEELKAVDPHSSHLTIDRLWYYFKPNSQKAFHDIVNAFYYLPEIKSNNLFGNVYNEVIRSIEINIKANDSNCDKFIEITLNALVNSQKEYFFIAEVEGISLHDSSILSLGEIELQNFKGCAQEIETNYSSANEHYFEYVKPFLFEHFKTPYIFKGSSFGDHEVASKKFTEKCYTALSTLRFLACLLYPVGYSRENISINLTSERSSGSAGTFSVDVKSKEISYGSKATEPQDMPIGEKVMADFKKNYFFEDLLAILYASKLIEIEGTIVNAVRWIGDAQNERNADSAYIKYWTVAETVFSLSEDNITDAVAKGISNLLTYGGFNIISVSDKDKVFSEIKKMYDKRSKIIHRGLRNQISYEELSGICKYAVWVIISLLAVRKLGYSTLEQLQIETNRLHGL